MGWGERTRARAHDSRRGSASARPHVAARVPPRARPHACCLRLTLLCVAFSSAAVCVFSSELERLLLGLQRARRCCTLCSWVCVSSSSRDWEEGPRARLPARAGCALLEPRRRPIASNRVGSDASKVSLKRCGSGASILPPTTRRIRRQTNIVLARTDRARGTHSGHRPQACDTPSTALRHILFPMRVPR